MHESTEVFPRNESEGKRDGWAQLLINCSDFLVSCKLLPYVPTMRDYLSSLVLRNSSSQLTHCYVIIGWVVGWVTEVMSVYIFYFILGSIFCAASCSRWTI
jgi:hypothetical protein